MVVVAALGLELGLGRGGDSDGAGNAVVVHVSTHRSCMCCCSPWLPVRCASGCSAATPFVLGPPCPAYTATAC
jgi:hypothetical protein